MPDRRPLSPADLYRMRLVSDARISPGGERIAYVLRLIDRESNDYIGNIYAVDRSGVVRQFTSGDKDAAPRWSPDGRYLAFLSGRKDKAQIHLMPADGGESVPLTNLKQGAGVPFWSPDGQRIAFVGVVSTDPEKDAETPEPDTRPAPAKMVRRAGYKVDGVGYVGNRRRHIFVIDIGTRTVRQITDGDANDDDPSWSPDGEQIAFAGNRSGDWDVSLESHIYLVSPKGGEPRQVTRGHDLARPVFTPDGRRLFCLGHANPEEAFAPSRIYGVSLQGDDLTDELGDWDGSVGSQVLSDAVRPHDEYGLTLVPRPDGVYFMGSVQGEAHVYRALEGRVSAITEGPQTVSDFSIAQDGTIAYASSTATRPSEVWVTGAESEPVRLTHENDAFLDEVQIFTPECFWFRGAGGEQSQGWLLAPAAHETDRLPLITYIHGGPQLAHGEAFFFEYQMLAGQGYGVFYPNIHGSSSYGRAYQSSIFGDWGHLDFEDVMAGTEEAARRPWVDRERLGIAGGSYGGYMTFWAMGHTSLFRAGLAERCVSNMTSFMGTSDGGWAWNRSFGVYPEQDVQKLWDMSPLKYAANVAGPLLVMQYEGDDRTPLEQGEQAFLALRRLGKTTEFIMIPEESHGLTRIGKPSRRVERMQSVLDWFTRYLG